MQVILLENIRNLGQFGDVVTVKNGFGRNFLLPQGKATTASKANLAKFEARRADLEKAAKDAISAAEQRASAIKELLVSIAVKAGDEGRLFGSVGTHDIARAISATGVTINKSEVRLPNGPLRQLGDYEIMIQLHSDVSELVKVSIIAE